MVLKVSLNTGINRIRLEFKANNHTIQGRFIFVLIESDWNLKWHSGATDEVAGSDVLIESDWNLKPNA